MIRTYKKLEKRAGNYLAKEQGSLPEKTPRRKKIRIAIWVVEAVVFLAVLEHFLIDPLLQYQPPAGRPDTSSGPPAFTETRDLPNTTAKNLEGLEKVKPVRFPNQKHLAKGSKTALQKQIEYAEKTKLPIEVKNTMGMRFRLVPPGTFDMGSPPTEKGRNTDEQLHEVKIPYPFYIGMYPVTQSEWLTLMPNNPSYFTGDDRPVEEVTWYDALRFLQKLCTGESVEWGTYRLPTEHEWEYACRAGTSTAFVCGNDAQALKHFAVYKPTAVVGTGKVGQKLANAWGLFDVHGNVMEWCLTKYYNYEGEEITGVWRGARAVRGGNWHAEANECRSANRFRLGADSHGNILGFRVVREISREVIQDTTDASASDVSIPPDPAILEEKQKKQSESHNITPELEK